MNIRMLLADISGPRLQLPSGVMSYDCSKVPLLCKLLYKLGVLVYNAWAVWAH